MHSSIYSKLYLWVILGACSLVPCKLIHYCGVPLANITGYQETAFQTAGHLLNSCFS